MPSDILDDVDLGRQVARDLEANFLLGNLGLRPNLHSIPPVRIVCLTFSAYFFGRPRRGPTHQAGFFFVLQAGLVCGLPFACQAIIDQVKSALGAMINHAQPQPGK